MSAPAKTHAPKPLAAAKPVPAHAPAKAPASSAPAARPASRSPSAVKPTAAPPASSRPSAPSSRAPRAPAGFPEAGELTLATVRKVMPYGAFCALDEYGGAEALLHVSEVSSGWVKNVRDFVKEGQRLVVLVSNVNRDKNQIDLSLKRVSESDRRRKLEGIQSAKRAEKIIETVSKRLGKKPADVQREADVLAAEFGDLFTAFEHLATGGEPQARLSADVLAAFRELAEKEFKPKEARVRALLTLQSFEGDGLPRVQRVLAGLEKLALPPLAAAVKYLGSGRYFVDVAAPDYKQADKLLSRAEAFLEDAAKKERVAFNIEKAKA